MEGPPPPSTYHEDPMPTCIIVLPGARAAAARPRWRSPAAGLFVLAATLLSAVVALAVGG